MAANSRGRDGTALLTALPGNAAVAAAEDNGAVFATRAHNGIVIKGR